MGFSEDLIEAIQEDYLNSDHFSDAEKAAMRWAEVLTNKEYQAAPGKPPQNGPAMAELRKHFSDAQIIEITFVSGFFNFWNRFTDGLQIDIEEDPTMNLFKKSVAIDPEKYVAYMRDCWWNHADK